MKILTALVISTVLLSCNSKTEPKPEQADLPGVKPATQQCFLYAKNKDTIMLSYMRSKDSVVGQAVYKFFEKDGNFGKFTGVFHGDTLITTYDFESEGMMSRREERFVQKGAKLFKGTGRTTEKGNAQVFENTKQVRFDSGLILRKTACH